MIKYKLFVKAVRVINPHDFKIYIPRQEIIELRSLSSSYELFKRQKTSLTNRIHSLIKQQFIPYQSIYLKKEIKRIRAEQLLSPVFDKQIEIFETQIASHAAL